MELCDIFDASGTWTGRTVARGTELPPGEYYRVVQVWIRNENGDYLVQQRALHLVSGPGMWATTAGYVLTGEESVAGAVREVREELGLELTPSQFRLFDRMAMNHLLQDIWLVEVSSAEIGQPMLGPEVADWQWASKNALARMIEAHAFFAYSYFARLPD
ncbi:MAG: NUDIX domain-containing protein [Anaerolineae bacterium]|nr:NUDIX domain-containing protein [Anaerolineae bacterium]